MISCYADSVLAAQAAPEKVGRRRQEKDGALKTREDDLLSIHLRRAMGMVAALAGLFKAHMMLPAPCRRYILATLLVGVCRRRWKLFSQFA